MDNKIKTLFGVLLLVTTLVFFGCATMEGTEVADLQSQLNQKDKELKALKASKKEQDQALKEYKMKVGEEARAAFEAEMRAKEAMKKAEEAGRVPSESMLLPPYAKPGECYARIFVPPRYETLTEQVLKRGGSERVEVVPAKYEWVEEKVLVKEASTRLEVVPARYDFVEEKVLVEEASARMEEIPAKFEWVEERILAKPAETVWKKGRGPIERVDDATGEIMCLVEVPAVYKTVKKKVMVNPPATRVVEIPATYKSVKKKVMVNPPSTRTIEIPAAYKTVKVRKLVSPPQERRISIPAEYQTVTKTAQVSDGRMEWRRILCETNMTTQMISRIQTALKDAGHDPGPVDGMLGPRTRAAVQAYQKEKALATGGLTYRTIESLGIRF